MVLNVHAENKTENNEILRLYFCEVEGDFNNNTEQWGTYLERPSKRIDILEFKESNEWSISFKDSNQQNIEGVLKQCKETETHGGFRYTELELPAGTYTEFSLTVVSENTARIAVIPVFEREKSIYGEPAVIYWRK